MPDELARILSRSTGDQPFGEVPAIDPVLVADLDRRFPDKCPDPKDTKREIWMKAGERRLVVFLKAHLAHQGRT